MAETTLNILQINTIDNRGGAACVARGLLKVYRDKGHYSKMAVGYKDSKDPDILVLQNDKYKNIFVQLYLTFERLSVRFKGRGAGIGRLHQILRSLAEPGSRIRRMLGQEDFEYPGIWHLFDTEGVIRPDIIHCHNLHGGYFDLRALPWLSKEAPVVVTMHDAWLIGGHCAHSFGCDKWKEDCVGCPNLGTYEPIKRDAASYNLRRKNEIYKRSRFYVATPSKWLMDKVDESILSPAILEKKIVPNGVDTSLFRPGDKRAARQKLGLKPEADILLFVSHGITGNEFRGYNMIEEVVSILAREARARPLITICLGEDNEEKRFNGASIYFVPFRENPSLVASYYQAADVYIHPAIEDNAPIVVIEALACGLPAVATEVGGIPEIINDGKTGFLVPSRDSGKMAYRVRQLLDDTDMLKSFSEEAANESRRNFDINRQAKAYLSWYREILDKKM